MTFWESDTEDSPENWGRICEVEEIRKSSSIPQLFDGGSGSIHEVGYDSDTNSLNSDSEEEDSEAYLTADEGEK